MAEYQGIVENGQVRWLGDEIPPDGTRVSAISEDIRGITGAEILASGIVGMWADRDDIGDTVEWVERLRRRWERRED